MRKPILLLLLVLALLLAGCVTLTPEPTQPSPTAVALATTAPSPTALPSPTPTATQTIAEAFTPTPTAAQAVARPSTATPTATATSTVRTALAAATATPTPLRSTATPTRTSTPQRPTATPTPAWPRTLIIREADIEAAAAGNAVPGLQVQGLDVTLSSSGMTLTFASLRYGFVALRNVTVQGYFTVTNGDVTFVAERIQPRNLATAVIPGMINQALDGYLADWHVESLRSEPGRLVVQVRPR